MSNIIIGCIIIGILVYEFILFTFVSYRNEKRIWNDGVCESSGKRWECFNINPSGVRGYSDRGGVIGTSSNYCWISWSSIDDKYV